MYVPVIAYCRFNLIGCKIPTASNFLPNALTTDNSLCQYAGCNDPEAYNYDTQVSAALAASKAVCGCRIDDAPMAANG